MFSDILQEKRQKWAMASGLDYEDPDIMSYKPEYSWNYEIGGHFSLHGGGRAATSRSFGSTAATSSHRLPRGQTTGRMMANAGRTRSRGVELSVQATPWRHLD